MINGFELLRLGCNLSDWNDGVMQCSDDSAFLPGEVAAMKMASNVGNRMQLTMGYNKHAWPSSETMSFKCENAKEIANI